jgi:hypothetical protein
MRGLAALSLAGAVPAALGGLVFWAVDGRTTIARSVAFGFWVAAAVVLASMFVAGTKGFWRRTSLPVLEGWVFVTSSVVLTALGTAIDVAAG